MQCAYMVDARQCLVHPLSGWWTTQARVAHMPTATTTEAASRFTIGLKAPTRLRDEAVFLMATF